MNGVVAQQREISAKEALFAKWTRGEKAANVNGSHPRPAIPRRKDPASAPLSYAQRALWFFHQLEPNSPLYNIPVAAEFSGDLDLPALQHALNTIVVRHEILRTRLVVKDARPLQVIDTPS